MQCNEKMLVPATRRPCCKWSLKHHFEVDGLMEGRRWEERRKGKGEDGAGHGWKASQYVVDGGGSTDSSLSASRGGGSRARMERHSMQKSSWRRETKS